MQYGTRKLVKWSFVLKFINYIFVVTVSMIFLSKFYATNVILAKHVPNHGDPDHWI